MPYGSVLDLDWSAGYMGEYICQKLIKVYIDDLYLSLCLFYLKNHISDRSGKEAVKPLLGEGHFNRE